VMIFLHMKPFLYPASGVRATGQSPLENDGPVTIVMGREAKG